MRNAKLASFSSRLSEMVKTSSLSRDEISDRAGISPTTLSKYCSGSREPDLATVVTLADSLGCDCDYLLTGRIATYAEIGNTLGLKQKAIDTVSELKDDISDYAPCVYTTRTREKMKLARSRGDSDDFDFDLCITNAHVLNIALTDRPFLEALIDYLICPDGFELDAGANLSYEVDNLAQGVAGFGSDSIFQPIRSSVPAKDVLQIKLTSALLHVREQVQQDAVNELTENGYKNHASKLHGLKFRKWRD